LHAGHTSQDRDWSNSTPAFILVKQHAGNNVLVNHLSLVKQGTGQPPVTRLGMPDTSRGLCNGKQQGLVKHDSSINKKINGSSASDVSDMPWGCPQFCVAAVSQKLLPYNIIAFYNMLKLKL
jgi:hypothetical protein